MKTTHKVTTDGLRSDDFITYREVEYKVFNNVLSGQPPAGDTAQEVVDKVASTPGAIAVVPKGTAAGKAKVLTESP